MAIQNINTIDTTLLSEYQNAALANLGQRFSVDSEGISISNIKLSDIISGTLYNTDYFKITPATNGIGYTISGGGSLLSKSYSLNIFNDMILNYSDDIKYEIDSSKNLAITNTDNYILVYQTNTGLVCLNLSYGKVNNVQKVVLNSAIRFNESCCVYLYSSSDKNYPYKSTVYKFDKAISAPTTENIDVNDESLINKLSPEYFINAYADHLVKYVELDITFDTTENQYFKIARVWDINRKNTKVISDITLINNYIRNFQYDITNADPELSKDDATIHKASVAKYFDNNTRLSSEIYIKLFDTIIEDFKSTNNIMQNINVEIYIPKDYIISCYCNSTDTALIKSSAKDIYVNYICNLLDDDNINSYLLSTAINVRIAGISKANHMKAFSFNVNYNDPVNTISGINIIKTINFPYINTDNYWVIDGKDTEILAKGENAGNPNLITVYDNNGDITVLSATHLQDINIEASNFSESISVDLNPIKTFNLDENKSIDASSVSLICKLPRITKDNAKLLQYASIIYISHVNCVTTDKDKAKEIYGKDGVITTFWTYANSQEIKSSGYIYGKFNPVQIPGNDYVLDMNELSEFNSLIEYQIKNSEYKHPDRYTFTYLVFDEISTQLKNTNNGNLDFVFPVIRAKSGLEYADNYLNDLNLSIEFDATATGAQTNNIASVSNTISIDLNSTYNVTSAEYIPNNEFPILDLSNVLLRDNTTLNRLNIVSMEHSQTTDTPYYAYIGTNYIIDSKKHLTIGTDNKTINSNVIKNTTFTYHNQLDLNFNNVYCGESAYVSKDLVTYNHIISYGATLNHIYNTENLYTTEYTPCEPEGTNKLFGTTGENIHKKSTVNLTELCNLLKIDGITYYYATVKSGKIEDVSTDKKLISSQGEYTSIGGLIMGNPLSITYYGNTMIVKEIVNTQIWHTLPKDSLKN